MPKMIPAQMGEDNPSPAEARVFSAFAVMPDTDNWTILHSVGIAKHPTQPQGEADFVVIIPEGGTFTLEVKGGLVYRKDGSWYSENRFGEVNKIKDPAAEASHASQAFKNYVSRHPRNPLEGRLEGTIFGFGVMFPDCSFHDQIGLVELTEQQLADADDCLSPQKLKDYLLGLAEHWLKAFRGNGKVKPPSAHQSRLITDILRPDFDARISLQSTIRNVENKVLELTENQLAVLEGLMDNERCLVRGGAGTGKTTLSLNLAERMCREGKRVGLFCFNKQLAFDLQRQTSEYPGILCGSLTEYMRIISFQGGFPMPEGDGDEVARFYLEELPSHFMEAFAALDLPQLDYLILDEGQDLMRPSYLDAMDWMLKGGLAKGSWFFFMDAERQDLYGAAGDTETVRAELKNRGISYTNFMLTDNCRNSGAITAKINEIFGTVTRQRPGAVHGEPVVFRNYKDDGEQRRIISEILDHLHKNGIAWDQVVILSALRFENSSVRELTGWPLTTSYEDRRGKILFSTVHTYKGLDSPVVILTDINHFFYVNQKMTLYVGMSRAKSLLYVLTRQKTWGDIQEYSRSHRG